MSGTLHLAQAQSNRGAGGRKKDFPGAERLVKRLVAQELTLSFVPDAEQRLWRTVMRRKHQVTRNRVQLQNRLCDAFQACTTLHPVYRRKLKLTLEALRLIEDHLGQLDQQTATPRRSAPSPIACAV